MKDLRGDAAAQVVASSSECFQLLLAIERYPEWHPDVVRLAEVTRRGAGGWPTMATTTVHLGVGPLHRDFRLVMEVDTTPDHQVSLTRVPHDSSDPERFIVAWHIEPGPTTRLAMELRATLDVPRLLPLRGVGDAVAQGFVAAAGDELARRAG